MSKARKIVLEMHLKWKVRQVQKILSGREERCKYLKEKSKHMVHLAELYFVKSWFQPSSCLAMTWFETLQWWLHIELLAWDSTSRNGTVTVTPRNGVSFIVLRQKSQGKQSNLNMVTQGMLAKLLSQYVSSSMRNANQSLTLGARKQSLCVHTNTNQDF